MKTNLSKNWWVLLVNGLLAILFGGLAVFATETLMLSISMYFGLLILIGGILLLIGAYDRHRRQKSYTLMFTEGFISVILGALIMIFPGPTLKLFFIFIGIWALMLGLFKIYIAIAVGKTASYRYMLIIGGILIFAIGLLLLLDPSYVAGAVLKIVGAFFIVLGMLLVYYSFSLRNMGPEGE
jgi:uncharacterized membrane protein HdeD (DUF308 family)